MKIKLQFLLFLSTPLLSCAQLKSSKIADCYGIYRYISTDSLSGIKLELNKDKSFIYSTSTDLSSVHAYGRWVLKKDTLVLNNLFDKESIPISVEELVVDTLKDRISIYVVNSLDGEMMDAIIRFNNDTTTECIPLFKTGCDMQMGSINSFRVDFNNYTCSSWYKMKSKKTNLIKVTVNIKDVFSMFFENRKFLYKNDKLYPLPITQITELDRSGKQIKREVVLQKSR